MAAVEEVGSYPHFVVILYHEFAMTMDAEYKCS